MIEHQDEDLSGSRFGNVNLSGLRVRSAFLNDVVITNGWVNDMRIEGHVISLSVNGIDVAAYVESELDRLHPERSRLHPEDVEGLRLSWSETTARAAATVDCARRLPPDLLDERVDNEFSFIETVRHLVFASDRWLTGPVFADPAPHFHRLGQPHDGAEEGADDGLDPDAHPSLDDVLDVRRAQQQRVEDLLSNTSDSDLDREVASPNGGTTTVIDCLRVVLYEEWWHDRYATRDLAILESRSGTTPRS